MELHLTMRRVARIQGAIELTLSDAQGDRTEPYSAVSSVENATPRPTVISPLTFNQAIGAPKFDFRFGEMTRIDSLRSAESPLQL